MHIEPLVITLTFYLNSPLQQMNNFFCLFVAAAAVLLTLSCAIVQWWPSSAFLLSLFAFLGLLQQSFHIPQSFHTFQYFYNRSSISFHPPPSLLPFTNGIIFDSIADPYDYTRLWTFMSVGKVFLNVVIFWLKVDEHRGDFEELWDAWSRGQLAIANCPALSGERIYPDLYF